MHWLKNYLAVTSLVEGLWAHVSMGIDLKSEKKKLNQKTDLIIETAMQLISTDLFTSRSY